MDVRLTWTDCVEAGDYVVPNVLSPRYLVSRPDNMDKTVLHPSRNYFKVPLNTIIISNLENITFSVKQRENTFADT